MGDFRKTCCSAIIVLDRSNKVLLQLRDNKASLAYSNCWSLVGGHCEPYETPGDAAQRELLEETGLDLNLAFWKSYTHHFCGETIDQYVYFATLEMENPHLTIGEGQALVFFSVDEMRELTMAFDFDKLLREFFSCYME